MLIGSSLLAIAYVWRLRPPFPQAVSFLTGLLILALALVSPLDSLSHEYLFSAHMLQHLLMTVIVPPLLLLGAGPLLAERSREGRVSRALSHPLAAWSLANGVMWVWHLPVFYNAALASDLVHIVQHAMFLGASLLFWWPVLASSEGALTSWAAMLYLFAALVSGSALGILLTFAAPGMYPAYLSPNDHHGLLSLVRQEWGISPADDQQLGGLLMWIGGGLVYGLAIVGVLARWFNEPELDETWHSGAEGSGPVAGDGGLRSPSAASRGAWSTTRTNVWRRNDA